MKPPFSPKKQRVGEVRPDTVRPYQTDESIERALNVAYVCDRPLLLLGMSGTGKSTLARYVAWCLEFDYFEQVITSRTSAEDLKWRFDAVRRLQAVREELGGEKELQFVTPGVLWEAFAPESAERIRASRREPGSKPTRSNRERYGGKGAVVLLDEIDKADPDVPNDLLVTLDMRWFYCPDVNQTVEAQKDRKVLVIITSNEERELPRAFLRRCIVTTLPRHTKQQRREIAELHRPGISAFLLHRIDDVFERIEKAARDASVPLPSTAEYLDAVSACLGLELMGAPEPDAPPDPDRDRRLKEAFDRAVEVTLWKHSLPLPAALLSPLPAEPRG